MENAGPMNIFLLLGSNLGKPTENLVSAKRLIAHRIGPLGRESSVYRSAPWGNVNQPEFLNQVIVAKTMLSPSESLRVVLEIELLMGRVRQVKWGPRLIDIDILFYDDQIVQSDDLTIPHPAMHQRRFTLTPLAEIAPQLMHPVLNKTMLQLLAECDDELTVTRI